MALTSLDVDGRAKLMKNYNEGLFEWWIKNPYEKEVYSSVLLVNFF